MFRTRDFVLVLVSLVFIVMLVVMTVRPGVTGVGTVVTLGEVAESPVFTAEVPAGVDTRAERLKAMRAKLAERTILMADTPTPVPAPEEVVVVASTTVPTKEEVVVMTCASYRTLDIPWSPQGIVAEDREGMRVYYEPGVPTDAVDALGQPFPVPESVRARIPLRTWPLATPSCLPTDVIGIGTDGSLMRNDELALYTVFGGDTIVGYALDGFPIYGRAPGIVTDTCGGAMVGGQYRYILDPARPGLITCFAGVPTALLP